MRAVLYDPDVVVFPSVADGLFAAGYISLIVGTYRMGNVRSAERKWAAILDGWIVAIGAATAMWSLVLWPYMVDSSVPLNARLANNPETELKNAAREQRQITRLRLGRLLSP